MHTFFCYMGGKYYMLKEVLGLLDYSKRCYVELFGGSGKVLLNKPPHEVEIYNDLDADVFNLWYVCKHKLSEFKRELDSLLYCEDLFKYFLRLEPVNDIERAVRTYYLLNCSVIALCKRFSSGYTRNRANQFLNKVRDLPNISRRIANVQILNEDFKVVLEGLKDRDDVMLYADPPYYGTEDYYRGFSRADHVILADYLNKARYSVMVSYYYFDGIEELYPVSKWRYHRFIKSKRSQVGVKQDRAEEILITNYFFDGFL